MLVLVRLDAAARPLLLSLRSSSATRAGVTGLRLLPCWSAMSYLSPFGEEEDPPVLLHYVPRRRAASRVVVGSAPLQVTSAVGPYVGGTRSSSSRSASPTCAR